MWYAVSIVLYLIALLLFVGGFYNFFKRVDRNIAAGVFSIIFAFCFGFGGLIMWPYNESKVDIATVENEYNQDLSDYRTLVQQFTLQQITPTDAYSKIKDVQQRVLLKTFSDAQSINREGTDKDNVVSAVSYLQTSMDSFEKYINDTKPGELSASQNDLNQSIQAMNSVTKNDKLTNE